MISTIRRGSSAVIMMMVIASVIASCSKDTGPGPIAVKLSSPSRLHDMGNGSLLVSDYNARAVVRYDTVLGLSFAYIATPSPPLAVAEAYNKVYVGNEQTGSIDMYDLSGAYLGILGTAPGLINGPSDIAVDPVRYLLFVADSVGKDVKVFGLEGNFVLSIKGPASGTGRLMNPTALAIDAVAQEVYVSDYGNPANQDPLTGTPAGIHVYSYGGIYRRSILGSTAGFSRPQGLAINDGHVFMADSVLGQVLVFDSERGSTLKTLGSFGSLDGQLFLPLDVVVGPISRDVSVADNRNRRITVFRKGGIIP